MVTFKDVKDGMWPRDAFPWQHLMLALQEVAKPYPSLHALVHGVVAEYGRGVTDLQRVLAIAGQIQGVMRALFQDAAYASLQSSVVDCFLCYTYNKISSFGMISHLKDDMTLLALVQACAERTLKALEVEPKDLKSDTSLRRWFLWGGAHADAAEPAPPLLTSASI